MLVQTRSVPSTRAARPAGPLGLIDPLARHTLQSGLTVQRMPLHMAPGHQSMKGSKAQLASGREGYSYSVEVSTGQNIAKTRVNALLAITRYAATLGGQVKQYNGEWKKQKSNKIDPFLLSVTAKYKPIPTRTKFAALTLDYQIGSREWTGYVVRVQDAGQSVNASMEDRVALRDQNKGVPKTYSNRHADTGASPLIGELNIHKSDNMTRNEKRVDAFTKLAGEGARWYAVRNHIGAIRDETKFYTRRNDDVLWVDFTHLWKSWRSAFEKAFDISDPTFAQALKDNKTFDGGIHTSKLSAMTKDVDYDLDNSRAHVPPPPPPKVEKQVEVKPQVKDVSEVVKVAEKLDVLPEKSKRKAKKKGGASRTPSKSSPTTQEDNSSSLIAEVQSKVDKRPSEQKALMVDTVKKVTGDNKVKSSSKMLEYFVYLLVTVGVLSAIYMGSNKV